MQLYKNVATALGLSNVQLAAYLGISNSLLHMSLKGDRNLPSRCFKQLLSMEQQLQQTALYATFSNTPPAYDTRLLRKVRDRTIHRYSIAQRRLESLQQRHYKYVTLLAWAGGLLTPDNTLTQKQKLWLQLQQAKTRKKMNNCNATHILLAQLQLEAMRVQMEILETHVNAG